MSRRAVKVCIMLPAHWSSVAGGAELQARYLAEALVRRSGVEVWYVCRHASASTGDGVTVVRLAARGPLARWVQVVDYPEVMSLLRELAPDVIYARVASAYLGMAARYCRANGCRLVWHIALETDVRPYAVHSRKALVRLADRLMFEYGVRRADVIVGQAGYQNALLAARFGRCCTAVIPNFHPVPAPPSKPGSPIRVVWVASIKPSKRPEVFLELARRLAHRAELEFVMIGAVQDDEWEVRLPREVAGLPNLTYLGPLPIEAVNDQLAAAHLFVNTSRIEGFPNTFVQAWLRRTVVISLSVDPDGVLSSGGHGRLSGTVERLVEDVGLLADDPAAREALADSGFRHAALHHSMANAERLAELILGQAERKSR